MFMAIQDEERTRHLAWEGCYNVRDLGGYPTRDGNMTRWGAVVRTDNLARLTEAGRASLVEYGVQCIIDLRRPDELAEYPNPFAEPAEHGIKYTNVSLVDPAKSAPENFTTLAHDYKRILDSFAPAMATIMRAIADAPEGAVLIHCMAGKDRTGMVAAILLDLAVVSREIIADDYALTEACLRPLNEEWLENGPGEREDRARDLVRFCPRAEVMLEVLSHLDERYGGVEPYLLLAGVSPLAIERIRRRLVDSGS
jgi:protein-tyrosine phosphatase